MKKICFPLFLILSSCCTRQVKIVEVHPPQRQSLKSQVSKRKIRSQPSKVMLQKGLILHYRFDENLGDKILDLSGKQKHGTVEGATYRVDKEKGGVYDFKGLAYIKSNQGDRGLPINDEPRSISIWVKLNIIKLKFHFILHYGARGKIRSYGTYNQFYGLLVDKRAGRQQFAFTQYGAVAVSRKKIIPGKWYHVVHSYHGKNRHTIYVNGEFIGIFNELSAPLQTKRGGRFILGSPKYFTVNPFQGSIASVRVYKRAINAEEVKKLFELKK